MSEDRRPCKAAVQSVSPRRRALLRALLTLVSGLALRLLPMHLPFLITKYGGSALWALLVYFLLVASLPRVEPLRVAMLAAAVAFLVELSRLHHSPAEDAFRLTLAGRLLLGRVFSVWNLLAYWTAIALAAASDRAGAPSYGAVTAPKE